MQPDLVTDLLRPEAWDPPAADVRLRQTHISWLFFVGERVYKVKKPVDFGFLDFSTLELRRAACEDEVRLNRRMAPEVYLGVVPITVGADGCSRVGGEGDAAEWAVEMILLPEHRMFDVLLGRGEIDNGQLEAIATLLVDFHAACATGAGVDEHGAPDAVAANAEENFELLAKFVDAPPRVLSATLLEHLRRSTRAFVATQRELLERRVAEHRVREGHGDLHAANLCITTTGIVAYDCIEFSQRLRCGDVAVDIAFLAMDLDNRGFPAFSTYFVRRYTELAEDHELFDLLDFYKGYRALVRAKVAALTAANADASDQVRDEHRLEALRYVQLAAGYRLPPVLVLLCGLPATGKSVVGRYLAGRLRAAFLRSDVRRKVLDGVTPATRVRGDAARELYSAEGKARTYGSLLETALADLEAGRPVVVDATFARRADRAEFVAAATRSGSPYLLVVVETPDAVIRERLARRETDASEPSDADLAVYLRARDAFEPPTELAPERVVTVPGTGAVEEAGALVVDRLATE